MKSAPQVMSLFVALSAAFGLVEANAAAATASGSEITARFATADGVVLESLSRTGQAKNYVISHDDYFLFELRTRDWVGSELAVRSNKGWGEVRVEQITPQYLRFHFGRHAQAAGLSAELDARIEGDQLEIDLRAQAPANMKIVEVTFGKTAFHHLGDALEGNVIHHPAGAGKINKLTGPWPGWTGGYPNSLTTYQMMGLYNDEESLYFAIHDPYGSQKVFSTWYMGGRVGFQTRWIPEGAGAFGSQIYSPGPLVIALDRGGWYQAAQRYRRWASRRAHFWPNRTEASWQDSKISKIGLWIIVGKDAPEITRFVQRYRDALQAPLGVHWYSWHQTLMDHSFPHFFPAREHVETRLRELKAIPDVYVMPYINGRGWHTHLEDFRTEGIRHAVKDEDGHISGDVFAAICPTSGLWRDTLGGVIKKLAGEMNFDGIYIDQTAAAEPMPCFDPLHGHPPGGGHFWNKDGSYPMHDAWRTELAPGQFFTSEGSSESYMKWYEGYLNWHQQINDAVPIFQTIYGGQVQLFGRADKGGPDHKAALISRNAQAFVWGEQLGWFGHDLMNTQPEAFQLLVKLARLRSQYWTYFAGGRMLEPVRILDNTATVRSDWRWDGPTPVEVAAVQASRWQNERGEEILLLANASQDPQRFHVELPGEEVLSFDLAPGEGRVVERP